MRSLPTLSRASLVLCQAACLCLQLKPSPVYAQGINLEILSQSHSQLQNLSQNGRKQLLRLSDELGRGIANADVLVQIHSLHHRQLWQSKIQCDPWGQRELDIDLPAGQYFITLSFAGDELHAPSQNTLPLSLKLCQAKIQSSAPAAFFWTQNKDLELELLRSHDCLDEELKVLVNLDLAQTLSFAPYQDKVKLSWPSKTLGSGPQSLSIQSLSDKNFAPEKLEHALFIAEDDWLDAIQSQAQFWQQQVQLQPRRDAQDWLAKREIELSITVSGDQAQPRQLQSNNRQQPFWRFELPLSAQLNCVQLQIRQATLKAPLPPLKRQHCFENQATRVLNRQGLTLLLSPLLPLLLFFFSFWGARAIKARTKPRPKSPLPSLKNTPNPPQYLEQREALQSPMPRASDGGLWLYLRDEQSHESILDAQIALWNRGRYQPLQPTFKNQHALYLDVKTPAKLQISHPAYLSWSGKIDPNKPSCRIELRARRNFAIACFLSVASLYDEKGRDWGYLTPAMLQKLAKPSNSPKDMQDFCSQIEKACFQTPAPSDAELKDLLKLAQRLQARKK